MSSKYFLLKEPNIMFFFQCFIGRRIWLSQGVKHSCEINAFVIGDWSLSAPNKAHGSLVNNRRNQTNLQSLGFNTQWWPCIKPRVRINISRHQCIRHAPYAVCVEIRWLMPGVACHVTRCLKPRVRINLNWHQCNRHAIWVVWVDCTG